MKDQKHIIARTERFCANNYHPLPLVLSRAEGVWVRDAGGKKYLDCLSSYSALNQGHRHPAIIKALVEQAGRLTLTSRAFHNDRLGVFLEKLCRFSSMDMALPMNTGVEAVETAIKAARKWAYKVKGVPEGKAEIIVCNNNFHGRTTTVVGFSSETQYRDGFGPFAPGFKLINFGDAGRLEAAMTPHTAAFLVEPIQGEGGINTPPRGYLAEAKRICSENNALFVLDEIQTGLGRTGKMFCHQHEAGAQPDILIVGKALGGGVYPVSAMLASRQVMDVFQPGDHGSTFGGNPLAAAVGEAALDVIVNEGLAGKAAEQGARLMALLGDMQNPKVKEIRGKGLLIGVEIEKNAGPARPLCESLMALGVLAKETHGQVIRLAPPLIIETAEIHWLAERPQMVLGA